MYKKYLLSTATFLALTVSSLTLLHACDTEAEIDDKAGARAPLITAQDKGKEKVWEEDTEYKDEEIQRDNMGCFADLPDEVLLKILHYKGAAKAASGLCAFMRELCLESKSLVLQVKYEVDFKDVFDKQNPRSASYPNIKLTFKPTNEQLEVLANLPRLGRLDLSGTDIADISKLNASKSLRILGLYNTFLNKITTLPISLQVLDLSKTKLIDISDFPALPLLRKLNLSSTMVQNVNKLSGVTSLEELNLGGCNALDNISGLAGLSLLHTLDVGYTRIKDTSVVEELTSLRTLGLSSTKVSDISMLFKLTLLRKLDVSHTEIKDINVLSSFALLEELNLQGTNVQDMSVLSALTSLTILNLERTYIYTVNGLINLTSLHTLNINYTPAARGDLSALDGLPLLKNIYSLQY